MAVDRENLGNRPIPASLGSMDYTRNSGNTIRRCYLDPGPCSTGTMGNFALYYGGLDRTVLGGSIQSLVLTPIGDFFMDSVGLAYTASHQLAMMPSQQRDAGIKGIAQAFEQNYHLLLEANTLDLEATQFREPDAQHPPIPLEWLRLTKEQIQRWIKAFHLIAGSPDPLRQMAGFYSPRQCHWMPLGTIGLAYEGLTEVAAMAIGMALKTGNILILYASSDNTHTHAALLQICQEALRTHHFPEGCLLSMDEADFARHGASNQAGRIRQWIAYGRPDWRTQIRSQVRSSVMESMIGNCYLYWAASGGVDSVREMILASHIGEPDAVNAIEKVLVHPQHSSSSLVRLWADLRSKGFVIYGNEAIVAEFPEVKLLEAEEWGKPCFRKQVAFRGVENINEAIGFINQHSSGHADAIVTESYGASQQFVQQIRSTAVYLNATARFQRCQFAEGDVVLGTTGRSGFGSIRMQSLLMPKRVVYGGG
jgi:glutamate-5-semialdehyde dehydrogenase